MGKNLVIVESPTKAKTISKFLDSKYVIESSFGHIRDLPKSKLGVDVETNFEPTYVVPPKSQKRVTELKKLADKSDFIFFATDEDREGEAISWHLRELLKTPESKVKRIVFHEITKEAILAALENPRGIDKNLVDAQQARRVLDRLVGYKLSPFLWKKVARGLSAGRVQSVAVRLIVEKEREIKAFKADEYWTIDGIFSSKKEGQQFEAKLSQVKGKTLGKLDIKDEISAKRILKDLEKADYTVGAVEKKEMKKRPLPPFTTSTLQQTANNVLGFSAKQTMVVAQQLYEGIALGSEGSVGLITYMRTDSFNLSEKFLSAAKDFITEKFGPSYTSGHRFYKGKSKLAQEAHEAIRPTDAGRDPQAIQQYLTPQQYKLYRLVWQRALASQMTEAIIDSTKIDIETIDKNYTFRATGSVIKFDGYLKVYPTSTKENLLPEFAAKDKVTAVAITPNQHFTQPPARYTEASLVKALEENGIGRPSTYAPTISTIVDRGYVEKEDKKLIPTDIAFLVNDLLVEHFPNIVDYQFTAELENELDEIAQGEKKWQPVIADFYHPFEEKLTAKEETVTKQDVMSVRELGVDSKTGKPIYVRMGRFGPFVQLGSKDDEEKPKFASLQKGQRMEEINLEDALKLLTLPRSLGTDESGNEIEANIGRFGPYIKVNGAYISTKDENPYTISRESALSFLKEHQEKEAQKNIKSFEGSTVQVLNGRYGPYITDGNLNAKIPKDKKPEDLTQEECEEILKTSGKKKGSGRRFAKKKKE